MGAVVSNYRVVLDPKAYEGIHLVESDGEPMDTILHRDCMLLLIAVVTHYNRDRTDFLAGGNNFIYFSPEQARNRDYRGPDFFYIKDGVDRSRQRQYWAVWEENGRLPDVIVELLSPTTEDEDRTTKFAIYEQTLRTPEYFMYDPFTQHLEGYRLVGDAYQPLQPNERGWLWSEEMQAWLGPWEGAFLLTPGTYLRLYTQEGELVLWAEEDAQQHAEQAQQHAEQAQQHAEQAQQHAEQAQQHAEQAQQRAEQERQRAEQAQQRAEQERQHAEQAQQRAEQERQRAEAAEREVARLKALLGQQAKPPGTENGANA